MLGVLCKVLVTSTVRWVFFVSGMPYPKTSKKGFGQVKNRNLNRQVKKKNDNLLYTDIEFRQVT